MSVCTPTTSSGDLLVLVWGSCCKHAGAPAVPAAVARWQSAAMQDPNIAYIDIGPLLQAARDALPETSGTVIHGEAFSLFEAMSAVEIGNPKMDTGMMALPKTLEQLLADGAAPTQLSAAQRLAIMDKVLEQEATWHGGGSLAQTVFTCLYMLKPERISDEPCLYALCKSVTQTCSLVRSLVLDGNVVEEEDFNVHAFGLPVDEQAKSGPPPAPPAAAPWAQQAAETKACLALLDKAIEHCAKQKGSPEHEAMALRLGFRKALLQGLSAVVNRDSPQLEEAAKHLQAALAFIKQISAQGSKAVGAAAAAGGAEAGPSGSASDVPGFDESVNRHLMAPAPPRALKPLSWDAACAFFTTALQHMIQGLQVRHVEGFESLQGWVLAFSQLRAGSLARSVAHYILLHRSWGLPDPAAAATTGMDTSPSSSPTAPEGDGKNIGKSSGAKMVAAAPASNGDSGGAGAEADGAAGPCPAFMVSLGMIAEAVYLPRNAHRRICADVDMFLEQSVIAVGNWCQAMLMNPCRQRRRLRRGLEDWGHLFHHALNAEFSAEFKEHVRQAAWRWQPEEPVEAQQVQGPLATWVERETCSCMLQHLMLGFELELYEPKEYTMIYWYCDALCNNQRSTLQMLKVAMPGMPTPKGPSLPSRGGAKGKGKKPGDKDKDKAPEGPQASEEAQAAWEGRQRRLQREDVRLERTHYLCQAYMRVMLALKKAGLLKDRAPPFNGDEERFSQRFSSFHHVVTTPEPLCFADYTTSTDVTNFTPLALLNLALEAFEVARKCLGFELLSYGPAAPEELRDLDRLATQNMMACGLLARSLQQQQEQDAPAPLPLVVSCDNFTRHRCFPAIGVRSAK